MADVAERAWPDLLAPDLLAPDLLEWTAGRLETWLLEQDGICILAAATAGAAALALISREFRKLNRALKGEGRLRAQLASAGCELVAFRVEAARRDGPPPAPGDGARYGGAGTGPGATGRRDAMGFSETADRLTWELDRGAGRPTAALVMAAPALAEARRLFDGHRAAARKTDAAWAVWAMLWRLEMEDATGADRDLAEAFGATDAPWVDAAGADELERLYFEAMAGRDGFGDGFGDGGDPA